MDYKVDVISLTLKTKNGFEKKFQEILDERVAQGYKLHSFSMQSEVCTAVFERETAENK